MKIAVYGSAKGDIKEELKVKAREIGREIARRGHTLITGACKGLPYDAVLGANDYNGKVIGFSPARNLQEHLERFQFLVKGFTEIRYIPKDYQYAYDKQACFKSRNVSSVAECDAAVFIAGGKGSNTEFANAYAMGRLIGVLELTGGITKKVIPVTIEELNDESEKPVIFRIDPKILIEDLEALISTIR